MFGLLISLIWAKPPPNYKVHNERVVGGNNAAPNTWKWQVSLQIDSYGDGYYYHICGGSIIDGSHIMTAAHCILSVYRVVAGEYNLDEYEGTSSKLVENVSMFCVCVMFFHIRNDIAILKLAQYVYDNGYVAIANLPAPEQMLPDGFSCYITGWGYMDYMGTVPPIMQEALIPVVEHSICSQPEWWGEIALKSMVCAGGDGVVSGCQGDSGGPLNCFTDGDWRVHGVVSYGPSGFCNQWRKPTVFTRVSYFLDWIYSVSFLLPI
uniref:Peptidase S1 domain-containing protein n=1 Tax=Mola mola TaxID=94237 RepID=A0A3Q3WHV2_MOLML